LKGPDQSQKKDRDRELQPW